MKLNRLHEPTLEHLATPTALLMQLQRISEAFAERESRNRSDVRASADST